MTKIKALIIDAVIMSALGLMLWGLWNGAIRSFYVAVGMFGCVGFVSLGFLLYFWLTAEPLIVPEKVQKNVEFQTARDKSWIKDILNTSLSDLENDECDEDFGENQGGIDRIIEEVKAYDPELVEEIAETNAHVAHEQKDWLAERQKARETAGGASLLAQVD